MTEIRKSLSAHWGGPSLIPGLDLHVCTCLNRKNYQKILRAISTMAMTCCSFMCMCSCLCIQLCSRHCIFALLRLTCWNQFANCISYGYGTLACEMCIAMVICRLTSQSTAFAANSYSYVFVLVFIGTLGSI